MDAASATAAWVDAVRRVQSDAVRQADRARLLPRPHTGKLTDIVEGALTQAGVGPRAAANTQAGKSVQIIDVIV